MSTSGDNNSGLDRAEVLDYIECVHATLDRAEKELAEKQAQLDRHKQASAQTTDLIKQAVEALVLHERIDPKDREKAAALLADPAKLLEVLIKTADPAKTIRPPQLGAAVREKAASAGNYDNHAGRRSSDMRESDRRWFEALGVQIPEVGADGK